MLVVFGICGSISNSASSSGYVDGGDDGGGDAGGNIDGDGDDSYELPQHNQDATQETVEIIVLGTLSLERGGLSNLGKYLEVPKST